MKLLPIQNQLSPRQKMMHDVLKKNRAATNRELVQKCSETFGNISRITVVRDLNDLVRLRYAVRSGRGRAVTYRALKRTEAKRWGEFIPPFLKKYFWDTDMVKLSPKKHATWIIERILEWGDVKAVKWLRERYSRRELLHVLDISRTLSHKSWHFWKLILLDTHNPIPCTRKFSPKRQETAWKY